MTEETLFAEAIDRPPGERAAFLAARAADPAVRRRVAALLAAYERAGDFLAAPAITPPGDDMPTVVVAGLGLPPDLAGGRYRVLRPLGEGGMGVVYLAEQAAPVRREVAIKVVRPGMGSVAVLARFDAERQALAVMDHPHIATVFDGGTTADGRPYFVMEYVPGDPITHFCAARKLTLPDRLELFALVCRAVHHAHQKGVIHRDLKPGNVLVSMRDKVPVPKVIDFGVAKALDPRLAGATTDTAIGTVVGTPAYMSPEQADLNASDVDTRSDIYALAVLLYELLTGTTPFGSTHPNDTPILEQLRIVREVEPPPPSARSAKPLSPLARELDWIVLKGLAKDRDRRYESAAALAEDVRRLLANEPVEAGPPSRWYRGRKFVARNKAGVAAAVVAAVAVIAGGAAATVGFLRADAANEANKSLIADVIAKSTQATVAETQAVTERDTAAAVSDFLGRDLLPFAATQNQLDRYLKPDPDITLRQVLDRAAGRLDGRFPTNPRAEAQVRLAVGRTYSQLGAHAPARTHLERAKVLAADHYPADAPEALAIREAVAVMDFNRGAWTAAGDQFAELAAAYFRAYGPAHLDTLRARTLAAMVLTKTAYSPAAESTVGRLVAECEAALTPDHDQTCRALVVYAQMGIRGKKYADARARAADATARRLRTVGPDNAQTWHARHVEAQALRLAGELPLAEAVLADLLARQTTNLGADHRDTVAVGLELGEVRMMQRKYPAAEPLMVAALAWHRKRYPDGHPDTAGVVNNLAVLYLQTRAYEKAEPLLADAVAMAEADHGVHDPSTLSIGHNHAMTFQFRKAYPAAEKILVALLDRHREAELTDVENYRRVLMSLGHNLLLQGKPAAARPVLVECLTAYRAALPQSHFVPRARVYLGAALTGLGRYDEAEPHLLAGCAGIAAAVAAKNAGVPPTELPTARAYAAALYEAWGQPEKAAPWKAQKP